jgi:chromosome segregation ATPase
MSKTSKQYGGSEVRQAFFERLRATSDDEIGKNPAVKIIEARDEILTEIRNKEIEEINEKIERLRVEIQNTNLTLESCRKRLDFFTARIKLIKMERGELRSKINEIATERARLIIRRNELEKSGFLTKY